MWNGLKRPVGPLKIKRTALKSSDVLVARLSGAARCEVATVRHQGRYFFVAPKRFGGIREVPADSLTDGLHASVWDLNRKIKGKQ